jgi:hypothetical protein
MPKFLEIVSKDKNQQEIYMESKNNYEWTSLNRQEQAP